MVMIFMINDQLNNSLNPRWKLRKGGDGTHGVSHTSKIQPVEDQMCLGLSCFIPEDDQEKWQILEIGWCI